MESPRRRDENNRNSSIDGGAGVGSVIGGGGGSVSGGVGGGSSRREARSNGRDRDRDRDRDRSRSPIVSKQSACRIFVSNLPYDYTWQQLKDLFREKVGEVTFAELYNDENNKAKGSGIVEFREESLVKKALDTMQRFEWGGRRIVVKDDYGVERDRFGSVIGGSRYSKNDGGSSSGAHHDGGSRSSGHGHGHGHSNRDSRHHHHSSLSSSSSSRKEIPSLLSTSSNIPNEDIDFGNTYGLSRRFLANLKITSPLVNKVFVANLDYVVDEQKLREVFRLAGRVTHAEVYRDKEGKSRGVGVVEYEHPVESVQAISMLNNVQLYDRYITVRMDRVDNFGRLPEGLKSVGPGLGNNGEPLNNVALNLAISAIQTNGSESNNSGVVQSQQQSQSSLSSALGSVQQQVANQTNAAAAAAALANPAAAVSSLIQSLAPLQSLTSVLTGATGANPLFNSLGLAAAAAAAAPAPVDPVSNNYARNPNVSRDYSTSAPAPQPVYDEKDFRSNSMYNSINNGVSGAVGGSNQAGANAPEPLLNQHQSNPVSDTLFLSNLPIGTSWPDLRERFLNYSIKYADIKPDGTGVIRFSSDWEAERALKMTNKSFFEGRRIEAKFY